MPLLTSLLLPAQSVVTRTNLVSALALTAGAIFYRQRSCEWQVVHVRGTFCERVLHRMVYFCERRRKARGMQLILMISYRCRKAADGLPRTSGRLWVLI